MNINDSDHFTGISITYAKSEVEQQEHKGINK